MSWIGRAQKNGLRNGSHLLGPVGLAVIMLWGLLLALSWSTNDSSLTAVAAAVGQETNNLSGGAVITIGMSIGSPGPTNPNLGLEQANAALLAISQTNAIGGLIIGGTNYSVKLIVADSACNVTQAITAANQLLSAGAVAIIGPTCSSSAIAAAPVYNTSGLAMVTPSAANPFVTQQGLTNTFRTVSHLGTSAIKLADFFSQTLNLGRTAMLFPANRLLVIGDMYQDRYSALGGTVVSRRAITATSDITPALTAIQAEDVDVILTFDDAATMAGDISRIAYNMGMTQTIGWFGFAGIFGGDYITQAGSQAAKSDYTVVEGSRTSDMLDYSGFKIAYLAAYSPTVLTPDFYPPAAYDTANIVMNAITKANSTDPKDIRDAIFATANFTGVVGIYRGFDAFGDVIPQWGRVEQVVQGKWQSVQGVAQFFPDEGGTVVLQGGLDQTTVSIPPGTTESVLDITYALVPTEVSDPGLSMLGDYAVRLESNVVISSPMTITVEYANEQVVSIDESTLALYTWNGSQWVDAEPCGGYVRNFPSNDLSAVICHLSDYVILGETEYKIHLPIALKLSM